MKYRVRHATRYGYSKPVDLAAHLLHLRPRRCTAQDVADERLTITPDPSRRVDRLDHFGNLVTWLFFDQPHNSFEVTSESVVEVRKPPHPNPDATPSWETVRDAARQPGPSAWHAAEFRCDSPMVPRLAAAGEYAAPSFAPGRTVLAALTDLNDRMYREFSFRAGATTISTPIAEVLERRQGVCQDFTHLMLSSLRALGIPARYTSGYIRTRPLPGQEQRRGADQSHAWVGAWLGPAHGWIGLDPTNGVLVGDEHVVVALGRDFSDISPVRGMILGGGRHVLRVGVDLEPIDPAPS
ncbi:MAG TPA: transglutaminase family protein [Acetobacteraceae bacterium]|nr:transglutaminase family protein [Acetobacteraceae bacterium]